MTRPRPVEFLIVGGGPAGATAAMVLAAAGREVVVVERTEYGSPRVGETLPPAASPFLARLGLTSDLASVGHVRCPGTICCWSHEQPYLNDFLFDPDGEGWHVDRAAFDAMLASKARDAGAEILIGHAVRSCRLEGGIWNVAIAGPNGNRCVQASHVVDAAGRRPWRGRPSRRRVFDRQIAVVALFGVAQDDRAADRRTCLEAVRSGWWYSASVPDHRRVAAYFTDADLLHAPAGRRSDVWATLLDETHLTRERVGPGRPPCELRVVAASSTIADPIVGERYIAVGDAASTIDPLSSQGILYALLSGVDAAEALLSPDRSHAALGYARGIAARFHVDLHTRQRFCQAERRWPDSPFWMRRFRAPEPLASDRSPRRSTDRSHRWTVGTQAVVRPPTVA